MLGFRSSLPASSACQVCQENNARQKRSLTRFWKSNFVCNPQIPAPNLAQRISSSKARTAENEVEEELWLRFFSNPSQWWDNRLTKRNPNYPDFKHKNTRECLWVDSWSKPSWVEEKLEICMASVTHAGKETTREQLWNKFFSDPSKWWDYRLDKTNTRYPDFRHKKTKEALWIDGKSTAKWVEEKLAAIPPSLLQRSVYSWNSKLLDLVKNGQNVKALELFQQMQEEGVKPDTFSYMQILKSCSSLSDVEQGRRVHGQIVKSECEVDSSLGNCVVNMYSKCGSIEDACRVFNEMEMCNVVGWSAIFQGYVRLGNGEKALRAFDQMQRERVEPDSVAFVAALNACSSIGALEEGRCIHAQVLQRGCEMDVFVQSCLVDMYSVCRSLDDACRVFNEKAHQDVVCWNAMIAAFMKFGQRNKALQLFKQMQQESETLN